MTLHCPLCAAEVGQYAEHASIPAQRCRGCGSWLDIAAIMAALGFPLLGADEAWRTETCWTCGFRHGCQCRRMPPTTTMGDAGRYQTLRTVVDKDTPACAEWRERGKG